MHWLLRLLGREERHGAASAHVDEKFELRAPSIQTALDLFANRWASDLSPLIPGAVAGLTPHFTQDPRPAFACRRFGKDQSLDGMSVLEIGPLEGAHTFQLQQLGASRILAVEVNKDAFLKCLIIKNLLSLDRVRFLLGDALTFLIQTHERFSFIFCSGVLYHQEDPLELIRAMTTRTDRIFVWTHYYAPGIWNISREREVLRHGQTYRYYMRVNNDSKLGRYWGGGRPDAALLERQDILRAFAQFGFSEYEIHQEVTAGTSGPSFSVSFWRPSAA